MANPLRITMFFDDGITGWSESHYDTVSTSLTNAVTFANQNLVPFRNQLLANGPWLKYIRASYDNVFRDSQVIFTPAPGTTHGGCTYQNNPNWATQQAATEWTCVLLRGVGGDLYRSLFYISGIPYLRPDRHLDAVRRPDSCEGVPSVRKCPYSEQLRLRCLDSRPRDVPGQGHRLNCAGRCARNGVDLQHPLARVHRRDRLARLLLQSSLPAGWAAAAQNEQRSVSVPGDRREQHLHPEFPLPGGRHFRVWRDPAKRWRRGPVPVDPDGEVHAP